MLKNLLCALTALICVAPMWGNTPASDDAISICSFNIHYDKPNDSIRCWANRKDLVVDLLTSKNSDVYSLQEVKPNQYNDLSLLTQYRMLGEGVNGDSMSMKNVIMYKTERLELKQSGVFWLSTTPTQPGSDWDAKQSRNCVWAKFTERSTGKSFYVFCTHFDHKGEEARTNSAYLLLKKTKALSEGLPFFVMGDLNATADSEAITVLNKRLHNSREYSVTPPLGPEGTGHGFRIDTNVRRIDYLYCSPVGVRIERFETIDKTYEGRAPSDHWPICIEATLTDQ